MAVQSARHFSPERQKIQCKGDERQREGGLKLICRKQQNQGYQDIQGYQDHRLHHQQRLSHSIEHLHAE
ncbi:hypothetical protein XCR1_4190002 [Xenorhabdus cabanillasii JM26]|uniref:Uncharacterized protein n=1 Tax=Xenorhabdus cabanillasii JM26 TaxID=1427517 RepID=W1J6Y7_9GAMM|nr:hypothetical protein XCR1_4190002 [Xenorhabdus cabanillasii JM26]